MEYRPAKQGLQILIDVCAFPAIEYLPFTHARQTSIDICASFEME